MVLSCLAYGEIVDNVEAGTGNDIVLTCFICDMVIFVIDNYVTIHENEAPPGPSFTMALMRDDVKIWLFPIFIFKPCSDVKGI